MRVNIYKIIKYFLDILNFNDQGDFEPRISIIGMKNETTNPIIFNNNNSGKKSVRGNSKDNNVDKNSSSKKAQPLISQYLKEFSHASISTKANETMNFKLDDSFNVNVNNTSILNISQDITLNNSIKHLKQKTKLEILLRVNYRMIKLFSLRTNSKMNMLASTVMVYFHLTKTLAMKELK